MSNHETASLAGCDIAKGRNYILVRINDDDQLIVNVMRVLTEPTYIPSQGVKTFLAQGLAVGTRVLTEVEGAPIELDLDDIGCPWRGSPSGMLCRTFHYDDIVHYMMSQEVVTNSKKWRQMFDDTSWTIHYTHRPVSEVKFEAPLSVGETALAGHL